MNKLKTKSCKYISILLLFIASVNTYAIEVPEDIAKLVATNYLRNLTNQPLKRSGEIVKLVYTSKQPSSKRSGSAPLFYVFNQVEGAGFVIISGDDNIKPILGYSLESNFDETNLSPQVAYWLSEYEKQISYVIDSKIENKVEKQQWDMVTANQFSRKRGTTAVKPLLKTTWDQAPFFNDSCPYDNTASKRTYTGCVATAMAQTMKYWAYPTKGTSSKAYTHATYGSLKANFGITTYNWSSMPNSVSSANMEIARLLFHAGVALSMNYGVNGSSAYNTYVSNSTKIPCTHFALQDYFGYDGTKITSVFKKNFTDVDWLNKMKTELDQGRIIIYEGNDGSTTGHCFLLDGYDANNYMHINWGWSGSYNGYFTFSNLVPSGTGSGGGTGNYSSNQGAVIGITPKVTATPTSDFNASSATTSVGNVITLTDLSTNYPNAWSWTISPNNATFVNGTDNTSKNPEISFSTPGKYTITLTSTNTKGSHTVIKTNYIIVNPALTKQVCDTLTNFLSTEKKTYISIIGGGSLAGHIKNLNGFSEQYSVPTNYTHVSGALLDFKRAETNSTTSTIKVNVYQNNNGLPGTILSSKNVKISDIKNDIANGNQTKVVFDSPVAVTGIFYIGFETTNAPGDTVGLYTSSTSGVTTNTAFMKYISNNSWCSYSTCWNGLKIHLKVSPMMAILPSANFTINSSPTQINTNVDIDASSSTDSYAYNWTINGASITSSNLYKETITYATSGTYDIKLEAIGGCDNLSSITKQIVVNSICTTAPSTPGSINGINNICIGQSNVTYSVTPVNGATSYIWTLPNGFIGTSTSNSITITAPNTQTTGDIQVVAKNTCGTSSQSTLSVSTTLKSDPTFTQVNSICSGTILNPLPTTSNNSIKGLWSPALDNLKTTEYTFTPTEGQCANTTKMTITVNQKSTPTFTQVSPICSGDNLTALPVTSLNNFSGVWSPVLDNSKTTVYTFTPNTGQCATSSTMTIIVNPKIDPTFVQINPICPGGSLSPLQTMSTNNIKGSWSPALDNSKTTTYIFKPNVGECANSTTMSIVVNSTPATPTFSSVNAVCSGSSITALPLISKENIKGSWSPAIDNTKTTTYTFTPDAGQCSNNTTLIVTVNPKVNPTFNSVPSICVGGILSSLPVTSLNNIKGSWSPTLNNTKTTTYIFTPTTGQCAKDTSLTILIDSLPNPGKIQSNQKTLCIGKSITLSSSILGGVWSSSNPKIATINATSGLVSGLDSGVVQFVYTRTSKQCKDTTSTTLKINSCASLEGTKSNAQIFIYPNPTKSVLNIQLNSQNFEEFRVIDAIGKILIVGKISNDLQSIDVSSLPIGNYIIRLIGHAQSTNLLFEKQE